MTKGSIFLVLLAATACTSGSGATGGRTAQKPEASATVIRGSDITGNVLESLRGRVGGMTISYPPGECPHIVFRGIRSMKNQLNPTVYVDGTQMLNTCILNQISSSDIDFIEVYPGGNPTRTGIQRNPFGVIMVFRVRE